jgi:monofunctional biosynthetic peptidoglycan transglycosylase
MKYLKIFIITFLLLTILPVLALRWVNPPTTSFMLQHIIKIRTGKDVDSGIYYDWVGWNRISPYAPLAVVAAEDQKFPDHWGFDRESISKALDERRKGIRSRGASTITQQVAKNLFLWPGKSFVRKGIEAYFTLLIELMWSKERILEVYLNIAQFGYGIYGIGAAGPIFFGKSALQLNQQECALMAAALPNPLRLRLDRPSNYMRQRALWIIQEMNRLDRIYPKPYLKSLSKVGDDLSGSLAQQKRIDSRGN